MEIVYAQEPKLAAEEFVAVLAASGLDERRPVSDPKRIAAMLDHANVIVTARDKGRLVGISRGLSDFGFCFYLSDLAVDRAYQGRGIGRRLIDESHAAAGFETTLILLAAPAAVDYYPHIGLERHQSCWIIPRRS
jgi:ribosomal protein S18 acetylase RimI-like enzyme